MGLGRELEGITVVSIEQAVAAPYCGLLLADLGARVIKVERQGGDFARNYDTVAAGHSAYFIWLNRGKESIVLNIDANDDLALLRRMLMGADIFLHNLPAGSLDRRGLSGEALRKDNRGLITCEITGYGRAGPYADMKAYDLLVQAESGLCSVTGPPEAPSRVGVSICDIATGLTAYSAILRALISRGRRGEGCDLSIAMFDVLADWMNVPLLYQRCSGRAPARLGVAHPTLAPYGLYRAGDGGELLIAIQSNREWHGFCREILEQPELGNDDRFANNEDRVANRDEMDRLINAAFCHFTRDGLIGKLRQHRIACANLNSVSDLSRHPQLRNLSVEMGGREIELADLPVHIEGARQGHVPALDEHGAGIRAEFAETGRAG